MQPAEFQKPPLKGPMKKRPSRFARFARSTLKTVRGPCSSLPSPCLQHWIIWDFYVASPWTRDGSIRVQVASVAPQVSGQITEIRVVDNQFVHRGDVLYVIDPFDFQVALDSKKAERRQRAADVQVKRARRSAGTPHRSRHYTGGAAAICRLRCPSTGRFRRCASRGRPGDIDLKRTQVRSPVNGHVTNLLLRVGDYADAGTTNISVIDADSYWIDGYFEETKMAHICIGDRAEAELMGYRDPIIGRVETVTRGISVSNAAPSIQGLPNVNPVYTRARLAQRVPVRIRITDVPAGVPLVSGMTATVTIRGAEARESGAWLRQRFASLVERLNNVVHGPQPSAGCVPLIGNESGATVTLPTPQPHPHLWTPERHQPRPRARA